MYEDLQLIRPGWPPPPGIKAVFTTRLGGVSSPPYNSLNLGTGIGDREEAVAVNRRRLAEVAQLPAAPVWLEQVHGADVIDIGADNSFTSLRADAVCTRTAGNVCAIRVADCMPVLFASRDGSVVGAAHAGWRGLAGGVLEATVARMGVAARELLAWLGPAIGPRHFEVGAEVRQAFVASQGRSALTGFAANDRGRWQCDLYALARYRLEHLGVEQIHGGGWCTFADRQRFFSFRRDGRCGRMAALIWIEPRRSA